MLLRHLIARDSGLPDTDLAFRSRGTEVSRLEGFSDTVFGFAIPLLVVSSRAPDSSVELLELFDTRAIERRCAGMAIGGSLLFVFSAAAVGAQPAVWWPRVFFLVVPVLLAIRLLRRRTLRQLALQRLALVDGRASADSRDR